MGLNEVRLTADGARHLHMSKTRVPDVVVFKKGDGRRDGCYQRVDEAEIAKLAIAWTKDLNVHKTSMTSSVVSQVKAALFERIFLPGVDNELRRVCEYPSNVGVQLPQRIDPGGRVT